MWLSVARWRDYQHYTDRRPPWIKLHEKLLDNDDFAQLSDASQLIYVKLLLVAARRDNAIPYNLTWLAVETSMTVAKVRRAVPALLASGFLTQSASKPASTFASTDASTNASAPASTTLASRARPRARAEAEADTETDLGTNGSSKDQSSSLYPANSENDFNMISDLRESDLAGDSPFAPDLLKDVP